MNITTETLERLVRFAEDAVNALDHHFERPEMVQVHGREFFRHANPNDLLMSYLKCVRSVSTLNACLILLHHGYVQEIGMLCRSVDDNCQDVFFLMSPLGDNGKYSEQQERLVSEFFQEEFDNADPLLSTQKRDRVPRQKVLAGIARLPGHPTNPYDTQKSSQCLQQAFSGYVHGAYCHIMEIYGGEDESSLSYHMHGLLGTPRIQEWVKTLSNYVYRTLVAVEVIAKRCNDVNVQEELLRQREKFETDTGIGTR